MSCELAGDPRPLLGHGDAGRRLALGARLRRRVLGRLGLGGAAPEGEAGQPGDGEHAGDEHVVAGRVAGAVVDDDRPRRRRDDEAEPGLAEVGEVAEQEGGGQAGGVERERRGDHAAVDERERGGQHPDGDRCGEREAAAAEQGTDDERRAGHRVPGGAVGALERRGATSSAASIATTTSRTRAGAGGP